ncbi:MAG: CHAP domain-containing protein, partial [Candidatus Dormibacteraeota bacterium]|nr:CHAP domain-containing protein [Candidatus Dormibacteraeota bacterium]
MAESPLLPRARPPLHLRIAAAAVGVLTLAVTSPAQHAAAGEVTFEAPATSQHGGLLAVAEHRASTGPYGTALLAGCTWATWVSNCGNLTVYGNGSSFDDTGCGAPNGCTFGLEFQCNELAQRYAYYAWGEPATWDGYGGDQGDAYEMWNAGPALPVPLEQFPNGGGVPPQVGDLMVFNQGWLGSYWDGAGHVAVVTSVDLVNGVVS